MSWLWSSVNAAGWFTVVLTALYYLIRLVAFIVTALGLHHLAIKRKMLYPWLAWVPVIRHYLLGQMVGHTLRVSAHFHIPYIGYLLPFTSAFMILLSGSLAGNIAFILTIVLVSLCYCSLFRQYREPYALIYGFMAGLPFLEVIGCFFIWHLGSLPLPESHQDGTVFITRRH
ncbi:MAG: hypothetical protein SCM11_11770 [Bacillota bacterium]|nr:hypothetical protein [Bacillota bacterium]